MSVREHQHKHVRVKASAAASVSKVQHVKFLLEHKQGIDISVCSDWFTPAGGRRRRRRQPAASGRAGGLTPGVGSAP